MLDCQWRHGPRRAKPARRKSLGYLPEWEGYALPHARNPEWKSIDKAVSSGCVRLLNHDIVDLYDRVPYHAPIVVHHTPLVGTA
ncbi:L,D-transpeptidase family protein [Agrobacterium sp. CFBP2214]|uniref:L,D-transpeptidase n=1 Tax=Agrobacterium sp. CFBP2214 TaxID=3040274 RepID=UPI0033057DE9